MDATAIGRPGGGGCDAAAGTPDTGDSRRRRRLWHRLLAAVALATAAAAAPAGAATYYIAPDGSDAASGRSSLTAFRTLERLSRLNLRPGDTVVLRSGGTYTGTIRLFRSGTAAAPITITASGPRRAILDGRRSGRTLIQIRAAHLRISHLELRRVAHAPARRSDASAIHIGRASDVALTDVVISGALTAIMNARQRATGVRLTRVVATGSPKAAGSAVSINDRRSTGWRVTDSTFAGFGDSCVIDQAGHSRFTRVTVRRCGYARLSYGTHGLYLKGPGAVLEDSRVSDVRRGAGSCVSPRAGAVLRRNRLQDCSIGIGFFDNFRAGGAQTLEVTANTISRTDTSAMYVDTVGLSPYTSARHRLVLVMRRNRIDASGRNGKTIHGNGIAVHAQAHGSAVSVVSTGNQVTGHIQESQALFALFYNVQRWPRGSTYRAAQNGYYDLNRRGRTRFSVPGIRWPYRLREFSAALAAAGWREAESRVGR